MGAAWEQESVLGGAGERGELEKKYHHHRPAVLLTAMPFCSHKEMRQLGGRGWVSQAHGVNGDRPCGLSEGKDPHPAGTVTRGKEDSELRAKSEVK